MSRSDPQWLNQQYNNRARIPEHPQIFDQWRRASELAREGLACELDLAYEDGPGGTLDVFPPERGGAPVLVFLHGGWWSSLDKSDHSFIAPAFVQAGAMVVVPNYALCPQVGIDHIVLQMVRALAWTRRHASRYGGDTSRIVVAGHSAGAHLAAMLMCCDWQRVAADLAPELTSRILAISGLFDLDPIRRTPFLQADLRLTPRSVRRLSPARFPAPSGTLYAVVGGAESEEFLRQNALIRERWGETVVPVCEALPGVHHLHVLRELVDPASRVHGLARELLGL